MAENAIVLAEGAIGAIELTRDALRRMAEALPSWTNERLVEFFRQCLALENTSFYARCLVCRELVRRYEQGGMKRMEAYRKAGEDLLLASATVREMVAIYEKIMSRLEEPPDWDIPDGFYAEAVRAEKHGVDPVEALRYAAHRRQVLGERYTRTEFSQDIRRKLPDPEASAESKRQELPSCRNCGHLRTHPQARLVLQAEQSPGIWEVLAFGDGSDTPYCEVHRIFLPADPLGRASACEAYFAIRDK